MTAYSLVSGYGSPQALSDGSLKEMPVTNLLALILVELRVMNEMQREAFSLRDDTSDVRQALFAEIVNTSEIAPPTTTSNPS